MEKIKLGIIGVGNMGTGHGKTIIIKELCPEIELVAIADTNPAKLEAFNLSGSIKDRVAFYIVKEAYRRGELKKGMEIVEATSGNTGIALSAIGKFFGNPVHIFMPDWTSEERI